MSQKNKSKKMFNKHLKMYTLKAIDVVFKTQKSNFLTIYKLIQIFHTKLIVYNNLKMVF